MCLDKHNVTDRETPTSGLAAGAPRMHAAHSCDSEQGHCAGRWVVTHVTSVLTTLMSEQGEHHLGTSDQNHQSTSLLNIWDSWNPIFYRSLVLNLSNQLEMIVHNTSWPVCYLVIFLLESLIPRVCSYTDYTRLHTTELCRSLPGKKDYNEHIQMRELAWFASAKVATSHAMRESGTWHLRLSGGSSC
jgi:hypothetical protein